MEFQTGFPLKTRNHPQVTISTLRIFKKNQKLHAYSELDKIFNLLIIFLTASNSHRFDPLVKKLRSEM